MKLYLTSIHICGIILVLVAVVFPLTIYAQSSRAIAPAAIIEVVYFHAPNRCPTCIATEDRTKEILSKHFRNEIALGRVSFVSLDLKDEKNKALVEKYEIVFPTLLILKKQGLKEINTDYSTTAFQYAYSEPEKYEALLKSEIIKNLK